jgi:hypothetical protein
MNREIHGESVPGSQTCKSPAASAQSNGHHLHFLRAHDERPARLHRATGRRPRRRARVLRDGGLIQGEIDGPRACYCANPERIARLWDPPSTMLADAVETEDDRCGCR